MRSALPGVLYAGKFRIKKWGRIKIKLELKSRDISTPIIKLALTEIEEKDYTKTLYEVAEKKIRLIKEPDPYKKRQKLSNFLLQKGFEPQLVYPVSEELMK
jgi:regulatory protein